jgi:Flp pilus assembly protein TadD
LLAPALVLIAYRAVSRNGFLGDANFLIAENRYIQDLAYLWENLRHDYFWSSSGARIPYWRPVTKASWVLEYQLFQGWPGGYALVQLAWQVLAVLGVQVLARSLGLARRWAVLAGLLFGLSAVAIEPVSLLMARSDVVCASATLWAVASWHRWALGGRHRWVALHLLCVALALGSKETGIVIAPVITLWTLLRRLEVGSSGAERARLSRDLLRVAPTWILGAVYFAARWQVLRSPTGAGSPAPIDADPLRILASLARYLQNLIPFRLSSTIRNLPHAEAESFGYLLTAALTLASAIALLAWLLRRRSADALGLAAWALLALAPVLAIGEIAVPGITGKYPLADRWLYHALGAASLLAALIFAGLPWPRVQQGILVAAAGWCAAVVALNESVRAEYVSAQTMFRTEDRAVYFATPPEFRTPEDECRFQDREHLRAAEANDLATALARVDQTLQRCPDDVPTRKTYRFLTLVGLGRFDEARPLAEALLENPPADPRGHASLTYSAGIAFLETDSPELAERWLLASRQLGNRSCAIERQLARAAIANLRPDLASRRLEAAYLCDGSRNPGLLIDAASWSVVAGQPDRSRKLLARVWSEREPGSPLERGVAQVEAQMLGMARPR